MGVTVLIVHLHIVYLKLKVDQVSKLKYKFFAVWIIVRISICSVIRGRGETSLLGNWKTEKLGSIKKNFNWWYRELSKFFLMIQCSNKILNWWFSVLSKFFLLIQYACKILNWCLWAVKILFNDSVLTKFFFLNYSLLSKF